jgi:hypothetical protein
LPSVMQLGSTSLRMTLRAFSKSLTIFSFYRNSKTILTEISFYLPFLLMATVLPLSLSLFLAASILNRLTS